MIELIRRSRSITVTGIDADGTQVELQFNNGQCSKKLAHDIAIAIQDFFNNHNDYDESRQRYN